MSFLKGKKKGGGEPIFILHQNLIEEGTKKIKIKIIFVFGLLYKDKESGLFYKIINRMVYYYLFIYFWSKKERAGQLQKNKKLKN